MPKTNGKAPPLADCGLSNINIATRQKKVTEAKFEAFLKNRGFYDQGIPSSRIL